MEGYQQRLRGYWPQVESYFDGLPAGLYEQGRLLRIELSLAWSDSGRLEDILSRPGDLPVLQYHLWLLDDLGADAPPGAAPAMFRAAVLTLANIHLHQGLRTWGSFVDRDFVALADELARGATIELVTAARGDPAVLEAHASAWRDFHRAVLAEDDRADGPVLLDLGGARLAPLAVGPAAAAVGSGRSDLLPGLISMLDDLHSVFVIRRDLLRLRADLGRGRTTTTASWLLAQAGIEEPLADPARLLGSIMLSYAVDRLAGWWAEPLEAYRSAAAGMGLDRFRRYADHLEGLMEGLRRIFAIRRGGHLTPAPPVGTVDHSRRNPLGASIAMAEGYLSSDPSLRESWEIHRWGLGGSAEVTARFPAGLVLEILARHHHQVSGQIAAYCADIREKEFAYYDLPAMPYVESDTLGILLRLARFSDGPEGLRSTLEPLLALLIERVGPDGRIPVWLSSAPPGVRLLGEGCGTIEGRVLCGLVDYDPEGRRELIEGGTRHLLERFVARGAAVTVNYPRTYALVVLADLLEGLEMLKPDGDLAGLARRAEGVLLQEIERERVTYGMTPQRAALLTRACLREVAAHLFDPEWLAVILERQRSDGRWPGEPLFFVPNRGEAATWYASDLLTSAFCYDALETYRRWPVD